MVILAPYAYIYAHRMYILASYYAKIVNFYFFTIVCLIMFDDLNSIIERRRIITYFNKFNKMIKSCAHLNEYLKHQFDFENTKTISKNLEKIFYYMKVLRKQHKFITQVGKFPYLNIVAGFLL